MPIPTYYLLAAGLAAGVAGWMLTGDIVQGGNPEARPETIQERNERAESTLFRVETAIFTAEERQVEILVRGSTEATENVAVRSETTGILNTRHVRKGAFVNAGDLICTLNVGAREAAVAEMRARLDAALLDFRAAEELVKDGFATQTRMSSDKATVDAARASLKAAEIELERTEIRAPISGIVQDPFAKVGDMLQMGDICANIMKPETMKMIAQVSERYVGKISLDDDAYVKLVTAQTLPGKVSFIAPSADIETRTFRLEIALPNDDGSIRDGVTATATISLPGDTAHLLPASALTLDDAGRLGVRTVDQDGIVDFKSVSVLDDTRDGMWVAGLPPRVQVIVLGQDYVVPGQKVEPVIRTAEVAQ